jgi:hypothetical protein
MEIKNDSMNHPLRFIVGKKMFGQFYNSWDKKFHLAEYHNRNYLCGETGNFSPSRNDIENRNKCKKCYSLLNEIADNQ